MEPSKTVGSSLSAVTLVDVIDDDDLDDLLVFTQKQKNKKHGDHSQFQYHQAMDINFDTTDLFRDFDEVGEPFHEKTRKYSEFNLSFPAGTPEPSLLLNTQKTDKIELSGDSVQNKKEESMFVHPQLKNEPLDLSITSNLFTATRTSKLETEFTLDEDLDLEFSADPFFPIDGSNKWDVGAEEDPYQVGPSTSRGPPTGFSARNNSPAFADEDPYQVGPSTSRKPPMGIGFSAAEEDPYQVGPSTSRGPPPMEFSVHNESTASEDEDPSTSRRLPMDIGSSAASDEEEPHQERPRTLRRLPLAYLGYNESTAAADSVHNESKSTASAEANPSQMGPKTTRKTPMDFLTLTYSQISLEDAEPTANTRRNLHSSQNVHQIDTTQIPSSVLRLYETIKVAYSDFAFVYSLASQLCQDRVPMDCFVHLKIGLLLSIASLEDNPNRPPISVVAIGQEFPMANLLMQTIGDLAPRLVGPDDGFKVPTPRITKKEPYTWVYADPIVIGKGGIYYAGDWGRFKAPRSFKLFKIIELGRVALEKTTVTCPLETAIWTHWRSYEFNTKDEHTFNQFIEIFGIPLVIEEDNHEALVDLILERASVKKFESTIDELSIGTEDMREFLGVICKRRVDVSDEASEILKKYFVASRMDRPDILARRSFSTLKLFAESFAKLSLRHDVIMIDAIAAIYMTENFIQNMFGPGTFAPPEFQAHSYIGAVDEHMVKFQEWVNNYVLKFEESD